jgi:hypothetical protein
MAVPARPASGAPIDSAWGGIVHDAAVALDVQYGTVVTTHSSQQTSAIAQVTFPRPFAGPPVVVLGCGNYNYSAALNPSPTATGFGVATYRFSGAVSGTVPNQWVAIGPRA